MSFGVWHVAAALEKQHEKEQQFLYTPGNMEHRKRAQSSEKSSTVAPSKVMIKEANTQLMMMFEKIATLESELDIKRKELSEVTSHYSGTSDVVRLLESRIQQFEEDGVEKDRAHSAQLVSYQEQCQKQLNIMKEQCKLQIRELNDYMTSYQRDTKTELEQYKKCNGSSVEEKESLQRNLSEKDRQVNELSNSLSEMRNENAALKEIRDEDSAHLLRMRDEITVLEQMRDENEALKQKNIIIQKENTVKGKQLAVLLSAEDSVIGLVRLISEIKSTVSDNAALTDESTENVCTEQIVVKQSVVQELTDLKAEDVIIEQNISEQENPVLSEQTNFETANEQAETKISPTTDNTEETRDPAPTRAKQLPETTQSSDPESVDNCKGNIIPHTSDHDNEQQIASSGDTGQQTEIQKDMTASSISDSSYVNVVCSEIESYQDISSTELDSSRSRDSSNSSDSTRHREYGEEECCQKGEVRIEEKIGEEVEEKQEDETEEKVGEEQAEEKVEEKVGEEEIEGEEKVEENRVEEKVEGEVEGEEVGEEAKEECCQEEKEEQECSQKAQTINEGNENNGGISKPDTTSKPGFIFTINPSVVPGSIIRTPERPSNRPQHNLYEDSALDSTVV